MIKFEFFIIILCHDKSKSLISWMVSNYFPFIYTVQNRLFMGRCSGATVHGDFCQSFSLGRKNLYTVIIHYRLSFKYQSKLLKVFFFNISTSSIFPISVSNLSTLCSNSSGVICFEPQPVSQTATLPS